MSRIKPFAYDVVETDSRLLFVFPYQGSDGEPASTLLAANGLQLTRADGGIIRFGNLHPRIREVLGTKLVFACEVNDEIAVIYGADGAPNLTGPISDLIGPSFYWYIGPETSTLREVAERPLAKLLAGTFQGPVAVAPGTYLSGPPIGLCKAHRNIVVLARGRKWAQARSGLVVDLGFASGAASGYSVTDDVAGSVQAAHSGLLPAPVYQARRSWSSQIACAFRVNPEQESQAAG